MLPDKWSKQQGTDSYSVIAVTGLAGHAFGSWSVDHHLMWLRDFLPSDIPRIRVITYGYNSQLTETMSRQDFDLHAEDFAEGLEALWRSNYVCVQLRFATHPLSFCPVYTTHHLGWSQSWMSHHQTGKSSLLLCRSQLTILSGPHSEQRLERTTRKA